MNKPTFAEAYQVMRGHLCMSCDRVARMTVNARRSTEESSGDLRAALARLIEVYDAMGCPRGPARIVAEAALAETPHA